MLYSQGRTQYTPRQDYHHSSITSIIKPAADGYVPANGLTPLYDGPDVHNPNFDVEEGIDVEAVLLGRRRLSETNDKQSSVSSTDGATTTTTKEEKPDDKSIVENRKLQEIVVGKGWEITGEPQGECDGTYEKQCARSADVECFLIGHHDARGSIVGNELSGWLVMNLSSLKEGIITLKIHTWHYASENPRTARWSTVNNEPAGARRLGQPAGDPKPMFDDVAGSWNVTEEVDDMWDRAWRYTGDDDDDDEYDNGENVEMTERHRKLKMRSYECPELPDSFRFEYAINGNIVSWDKPKFLEKKQNLQRVVETVTLLDDPNFTSEAKDVELAIRLVGVSRNINFGVSHVYWA